MIRKFILVLLLFPGLLFAQNELLPENKLVLLKTDSPLVAFRILFNTGSSYDPKGKEGVAALTASLLAEGSTQKNEYRRILELLYPMAASYNAQIDKEMITIVGVVHRDHVQRYFELLRDAVLAPAFKTEDFERLKADQLNYVSRTLRFNDDEQLGKEILNATIFKNHPYAHPVAGLESSVKSLTLDDVKAFYKNQFTRSNLTIGIGGDYPQQILDQMRRDFSGLPEGSTERTAIPAPQKIEQIHAVLVEKQTPATAISWGFPLPVTRKDKDFYPLMVMSSWLGQHRSQFSHLFQVMRELRGLNYGDYSYIEYFANPGRNMLPSPNYARHHQIFEVWIRPVQNVHRHFALRQAMREVQKLVDSGLTQADFDLTREFLRNQTTNLAQSVSEQLGYALDDRFYGLDQPFLERIKTELSTMKLEDVNQAIKKYLNTKNLAIAAVTQDAAAYKTMLVEGKPSPITYESEKPKEILEEDKVIMAYPIPVEAANISILPAEKAFE